MECGGFSFIITQDGFLKYSCDNGCSWKLIGLVKGKDSDIPGKDGTIEIVSTTTLEPGEEARVENTGDVTNAKLKFYIPKGQKGEDGDSPSISEDGMWIVLKEKTEYRALAKDAKIVIEECEDIGTYGTPYITYRVEDDNTYYLKFHCLKGIQGEKPVITATRDLELNLVTLFVDDKSIVMFPSNVAENGILHFTILSNDIETEVQTFTANQETDATFGLKAGTGITLTADTTTHIVTIDAPSETIDPYTVYGYDTIVVGNQTVHRHILTHSNATQVNCISDNEYATYTYGVQSPNTCYFANKTANTIQYMGIISNMYKTDAVCRFYIRLDTENYSITYPVVCALSQDDSGTNDMTVFSFLPWKFHIYQYFNGEKSCWLEIPQNFIGVISLHSCAGSEEYEGLAGPCILYHNTDVSRTCLAWTLLEENHIMLLSDTIISDYTFIKTEVKPFDIYYTGGVLDEAVPYYAVLDAQMIRMRNDITLLQ